MSLRFKPLTYSCERFSSTYYQITVRLKYIRYLIKQPFFVLIIKINSHVPAKYDIKFSDS